VSCCLPRARVDCPPLLTTESHQRDENPSARNDAHPPLQSAPRPAIMPSMRAVVSFKERYRQAPLRSATPPPPDYEPLSPILRASEPLTANPAGGRLKTTKTDGNGASSATGQTPSQQQDERASLQPMPPAVMYEPPPPRSAPLPQYNLQLPALGSPIDALADAAVSSLQASPQYYEVSRHPSTTPFAPVTALPWAHPSERAPKRPYPDDTAFAPNERISKRARSEVFPTPQHVQHHSRPATSHNPGWSYNVEQMADHGMRMYQGHAAPTYHQHEHPERLLLDAQLLLDFSHAVSATCSTQPPVPKTKRWSISQPEASNAQVAYKLEPTSPSLHTSFLNVVEHDKVYVQPEQRIMSFVVDELQDQSNIIPAVQTHTPPEEISNTTIPDTASEVNAEEDKKQKRHQGWPKGKPRGPRSGPSGSKKKKSIPKPKGPPLTMMSKEPDQLHSPQSLPAEVQEIPHPELASDVPAPGLLFPEPTSQARRHSYPNKMFVPQIQSAELLFPQIRSRSVPAEIDMSISRPSARRPIAFQSNEDPSDITICAGCNSSDSVKSIGDGEQWISCDGCKGWFHYACAGFKSEREVREVDKFYCEICRPNFGSTTKVRKSKRTHTAVDYAGLNEGILKTSDDNPEHHYIQAFKNGDIEFTPESFIRLPPEYATADFIEKMDGFTEPAVIPGALNPRPAHSSAKHSFDPSDDTKQGYPPDDQYGYEIVPDDGQDSIDMVIPEGLTVRRVAELYGPLEPVPVIDVKAQEGEDKRWTMAKWADYYEQEGEKPVRNVISLEVSRSKLGRLIRRPKVVRDMDLQDSVWPEDDKIHAPPVQFYCLMSVADCYTDFHIDFGGSSVYYHIIKGRKTFFFIPPTKQNLKKYEDWCLSPRQSHEFLGHQVKECYRVDLYPGDTMLIPSGWIHAVWTPENSLVIGGNYLTRIHYGMQIKVVEVEKNTKVAKMFRYPHFQKIMWLTLIQYLEEDPLPASVEEILLSGGQFERLVPIYCQPDKFGHNCDFGPENYNRRYYPKAELEGLPDLANYIWRTVMISLGKIEGITQQSRNAVTKSIPKGFGEPLVLARRFAMWTAWKRGNERIPQWAHPDATLPEETDFKSEKKFSASQVKRMERESLREAIRAVRGGERHSSLRARVSESSPGAERQGHVALPLTGFLRPSRQHITTPKTSQLGPKRIACDACRKRRIRCKHKDDLIETQGQSSSDSAHTNGTSGATSAFPAASSPTHLDSRRTSEVDLVPTALLESSPLQDRQHNMNGGPVLADQNVDTLANKSGRVKACADCRKSKVSYIKLIFCLSLTLPQRRCIHDENGNIDPVKASETPVPRGEKKKRRVSDNDDGEAINKKMKRESFAGLVNGEISMWNRYPLQARPLKADEFGDIAVQSESPEHATDQDLNAMFIDPQLANGDNADEAAMPSTPGPRENVVTSIEDHLPEPMEDIVETGPIDPFLLGLEPHTPATPLMNGGMNGFHAGPSSPMSITAQSVSPGNVIGMTRSASKPSRVIMTPSKTSYTGRSSHKKSATPKTPIENRQDSKGSVKLEPRSDPKPRTLLSMSSADNPEDTASLALALQLQMEEHGLRRRSK
jgi:F-box/leucine-rich repeat protein 10/11